MAARLMAVTAAGWLVAVVRRGDIGRVSAPDSPPIDPAAALTTLVTDVTIGMLLAMSAWLALAGLVGAATSIPGRAGRAAGVVWTWLMPRAARAALAAALGIGVATAPATALGTTALGTTALGTTALGTTALGVTPLGDTAPPTVGAASRPVVDSSLLPTGADRVPQVTRPSTQGRWPGGPPMPGATSAPASSESPRADRPTTTVTVRPGDSLWAIAARSLGPGSTNAEVAAEWPRWYALNRARIGPDPDLLVTGTVLTVPDSSGVTR